MLNPLFSSYELYPVAPFAQESVPVPPGLDLDTWIVPVPKEFLEKQPIEEGEIVREKKGKKKKGDGTKKKKTWARDQIRLLLTSFRIG